MDSLVHIGIWLLVGPIAMLFFTHTIVWHKDEKTLVKKFYEAKKTGAKPDGEMIWAWVGSLIRKVSALLVSIGLVFIVIGSILGGKS